MASTRTMTQEANAIYNLLYADETLTLAQATELQEDCKQLVQHWNAIVPIQEDTHARATITGIRVMPLSKRFTGAHRFETQWNQYMFENADNLEFNLYNN